MMYLRSLPAHSSSKGLSAPAVAASAAADGGRQVVGCLIATAAATCCTCPAPKPGSLPTAQGCLNNSRPPLLAPAAAVRTRPGRPVAAAVTGSGGAGPRRRACSTIGGRCRRSAGTETCMGSVPAPPFEPHTHLRPVERCGRPLRHYRGTPSGQQGPRWLLGPRAGHGACSGFADCGSRCGDSRSTKKSEANTAAGYRTRSLWRSVRQAGAIAATSAASGGEVPPAGRAAAALDMPPSSAA